MSKQDRQMNGIRLQENDGKLIASTDAVAFYQGQYPFRCDDLSVDVGKMILKKPCNIEIASIEGNMAIPTPDSLVPADWTRAVGVIWILRDRGMAIRTKDALWEALEPKACIGFSTSGVLTDKIRVTRLPTTQKFDGAVKEAPPLKNAPSSQLAAGAELPAVEVKRPELPKDREDEGIELSEVTGHVKPRYWEGEVPFKFAAGWQSNLGKQYTAYHEFSGWRTNFFYTSIDSLRSGIADGARTLDKHGKLLAEAKMSKFLSANGGVGTIEIEEFHYRPDGKVSFYCKTQISYPLGEKDQELGIKGRKERDYYFLWPVKTL